MKSLLALTIALTPLLSLSGCGYKLGEIRPTPMRTIRTLAIPTFKNRTHEPRIEILLADTLIKAFQTDGTYTIVDEQRADAILQCSLNNIERRSVRSVQNNVRATAEFEFAIEVAYIVSDRRTGSILMQGQVRGRTTFFAGSDIQSIERQAIPLAAADMAKALVAEISEGW